MTLPQIRHGQGKSVGRFRLASRFEIRRGKKKKTADAFCVASFHLSRSSVVTNVFEGCRQGEGRRKGAGCVSVHHVRQGGPGASSGTFFHLAKGGASGVSPPGLSPGSDASIAPSGRSRCFFFPVRSQEPAVASLIRPDFNSEMLFPSLTASFSAKLSSVTCVERRLLSSSCRSSSPLPNCKFIPPRPPPPKD